MRAAGPHCSETRFRGRGSITCCWSTRPGLGEVHGAEHAEVSADAAENADLVLLVVDGPLRDSEFQLLRRLGDMEKRVLLCLNKEDWYEPEEKQRLLDQLTQPGDGAGRRR